LGMVPSLLGSKADDYTMKTGETSSQY
jgi:hypothetical protein